MLHLDHLVILVHDLDQAVADYTQLGFHVTPGGTHADGLTHNALITFADQTYLELIAFVDPHATQENTWGWRQFAVKGGGLIDYCMAAPDLAAAVQQFRAEGLSVSDPVDGGRKRPDGTELRWRSARFWQAARELPFLIEDVTPRSLRVPADSATHPNGATGIRELVIAVMDVERVAAHVAALTGAEAQRSHDSRRDAATASLAIDAHTLTLAAPSSRHSPIQPHIENIGLGPYEFVLAGGGSQTQLDQRLTQSVRLRFA